MGYLVGQSVSIKGSASGQSDRLDAIESLNSTQDGRLDDLETLSLRSTTNRETLIVNKTLINKSSTFQNLINQSGSDLNVDLPASPVIDKQFAIINHASSSNNLIVNGITLLPNDRYEIIYDGVEWIVL